MGLAHMCSSSRPGVGLRPPEASHLAVITQLEAQVLTFVSSRRRGKKKNTSCTRQKSCCRVFNVSRREDGRRKSWRAGGGPFDHDSGAGPMSSFLSWSYDNDQELCWGFGGSWGNSVGSSTNSSKSSFVVAQAHDKFSEEAPAAAPSSLSRTDSNSSEKSALFYEEEEEESADSSWNGSGSDTYPEDDEGGVNGNGPVLRCEEESEGTTLSDLSGNVSSTSSSSFGSAADSIATGGKGPVYQVLEVYPDGDVAKIEVSRRQLLRSTGLRLRDIRSVDPALWVTNSAPALLVRDQAILLNFGSLRAIATPLSVLVFDYNSLGAQGFMNALLPRLRAATNGPGPIMPFELEVVEASLISRTQRLEQQLMDVEPRVLSLLKVLPNRYTVDVLEELRLCKQSLVELSAKAGALRQILLELLENPQDIRQMTIMGRVCNIRRGDGSIECSLPSEKKIAEDEEQEMEMLLECYLQRCDSCHGYAEKLLNSAREMEDSIALNLSSRRLEMGRLELLLQVATFCAALGALIAGIFGMNLKSCLEEHMLAFWFTTVGIIFGGIGLFVAVLTYLKIRRIL
ncbi:unnamed protein product [Sphagnum jensenii]|uniref:Magnesium transporter n=1 Tax=Sphagnum jensenii TaxID=128206 RepID=A0ABP0W0D8_9BRYO